MALVLKNRVKVTSTTTGTGAFTLGSAVAGYQDFNVISPTSAAWDISEASYNGQSFSVAAQEASPTGMFFKPDGTKMYIIGSSGDEVNEYNLSTAWDVTTSSFVQLFSVATEEINPQGLFFKPDGTKMYFTGSTGDDVNEYDLSTPWDISTAVYLQNFSVSGQDTAPQDLFFKPDGTKMYILGDTGDDVNEYNLSSAWDISTASYVQNFSVNAQDASPSGLFFKSDGMKMYVTGLVNDSVYEYNLSSAWNISTASYVQSFSFVEQFLNPEAIFFKDDGTQFFSVGATADRVFSYYIGAIETYYVITDGTDWEVGLGTVLPNSELLRTQVLGSSNSGALVNWGAGDKDVFCGYPSAGTSGGVPFCDDSEIGTDLAGWSAFQTALQSGITGGQTFTNPIVSTITLSSNMLGGSYGGTLGVDGWIWFLTDNNDPDTSAFNAAFNYLSGAQKFVSQPGSGASKARAGGGVLAPNGDIHAVPLNSTFGYKISVAGVVSTYSLVYTTTTAYKGGVLAPNGDVHFIPASARVGQKVSAAGVVSTYSLVYTAGSAYAGGVLAPNGDIHFVPESANRGQKISAAGVVSTYSLVYTASGAYRGGVLAPNGDIHFVPDSANRGQKISIDGTVSTYSLVYTTASAYTGGVLAPNGEIHFIPRSGDTPGQKISTNGIVSTYTLGTGANGAVLAPNGVAYSATNNTLRVFAFNAGQPLGPGICLSSFLNKF